MHDTEFPVVLGKPVSKVRCHGELSILLTLLSWVKSCDLS